MYYWYFTLITFVTLVIFAYGCWALHRTVRAKSSFLLAASSTLYLLVLLYSRFFWLDTLGVLTRHTSIAFEILSGADQYISTALALATGTSMLFTARVVSRSSNSFKPKPLRGSA